MNTSDEEKVDSVSEAQLSVAKAVLNELLESTSGTVPLKKVRDGLTNRGIINVNELIGQLRLQDSELLGQKIYFQKNKFFSADAYRVFQDRAVKAAEEAAANAPPTAEADPEAVESAPKKREHRQEEARLVSYLKPAMEEIYLSDVKPDSEYVFDVHNDRAGTDYENVDVLAVHWRGRDIAELIAVEAKLEFSAKLVQQANNYRRFADRVWIAVPVRVSLDKAATWLRLENPLLFDYLVDLGIGIFACRRGMGKRYEIQAIQWPRQCQPSKIERQEFIKRHRDCLEEAKVVAPENHQSFPSL